MKTFKATLSRVAFLAAPCASAFLAGLNFAFSIFISKTFF